MDELWQRYRTFWTPVLIGLGVFLVGVIAVHVISDDPDKAKARMTSAESKSVSHNPSLPTSNLTSSSPSQVVSKSGSDRSPGMPELPRPMASILRTTKPRRASSIQYASLVSRLF